MIERIKNWMKENKIKSSQLADNIGVNRSTVSHILSKRNKPSVEFIEKFINFYNDVDVNWLIFGKNYNKKINQNSKINIKDSKKIKKVVVFYDDNSYEELYS